jgi:glutamate-1-semialdehyde 2,1-aminomutase
LQGHPLGCAAGMATLSRLEAPGFYDRLFATAEKLRTGLREVFDRHRMGVTVFGDGPMWHFLFAEKEPTNYRHIMAADQKKQVAFDTELIREGIFVLPANRRFVSSAHTDEDLEMTIAAFDRVCRKLKA